MSWITESYRTIKALTTTEHAPVLPAFQSINLEDLLPGDALLFYGLPHGNELTERLCVNKYHCAFHPPFHAALMETVGLFHNVGQFTTNKLLEDEFNSNRRIDVIRYPMTSAQRDTVLQATILDTTVPRTGLNLTTYGIADFLHFGFSFVGQGKRPVCSANTVNCLAKGNVKCSDLDAMDTAPDDLVEYAMKNAPTIKQFTLHVGPDYHL